MSKGRLFFNKQSLRKALSDDTYQSLINAFGASSIDRVVSSLLCDSIEIKKEMRESNKRVDEVILRYVDPSNYILPASLESSGEDIDEEKDFTDEEFAVVLDGATAVTNYLDDIVPKHITDGIIEVIDAKAVGNKIFVANVEL